MTTRTRKEKLALNQATMRIANERMSAWPERRAERRRGASKYFCECSHDDCRAMLQLTPDEYEAIRADSRRFLIAPGHEFTEVERLTDERERYAIVEKFPEVASVVQATDPRRH